MLITICDLHEKRSHQISNIFGGEIVREYGVLCDMQFKECELNIYPTFILIKNSKNLNNNFSHVITKNDFSNIYVQ